MSQDMDAIQKQPFYTLATQKQENQEQKEDGIITITSHGTQNPYQWKL